MEEGRKHHRDIHEMLCALAKEEEARAARWGLFEDSHEHWCANQKAEAVEASAAELDLREKIQRLDDFVLGAALEQEERLRELVEELHAFNEAQSGSNANNRLQQRQHHKSSILRSFVWRLLEKRDEVVERTRTPRLHMDALQVCA